MVCLNIKLNGNTILKKVMIMKKFLLRLIIIFLAIFLFSSCIERNSSSKEGKQKDIFVITTDYFPNNLNRQTIDTNSPLELNYMLFDGLVKYDANGIIIPSLSKSWEILNGGLRYKFTLKESLYFSTGDPIDAYVIKDFFLNLLESEDITIKYKNMLLPIFGVEEYLENKNKNNIAINAIDKNNIEFNLNAPCSFFLEILSNPAFFIRDIESCSDNWKDNYKFIAYSGPYKIENIDNSKITFIKNKMYLGKYSLAEDQIVYEKKIDEQAMAMFDLDNVDVMLNVPKSEIIRLKNEDYLNLVNTEIAYTLNFNLKSEEMKSLNIRRELIDIIEKEKKGNLTFEALTYNSKLKDEDDLKDEFSLKDLKSLNMLLKDTNDSNNFIELLKRILKSYNIELNIKYFENNEELNSPDYDLALIEISPEFIDEISILEMWKSNSEDNHFGFINPEFDDNLDKAIKLQDNVEQVKNCQDILKDNYVTMILGYKSKAICLKNQNITLLMDRMGVLRFDL